ncbi:MAG: D-2-hydroxyacid dehydrogenase [Carboxydocellales bacterium]
MKIVSSASISGKHIAKLQAKLGQLDISVYSSIEEAEAELAEAEILLTYGEDLNGEILKKCKALRWIMVVSAGLERLPWDELREQRVLVTNARGIHRGPMSEYTLGVMLQLTRRSQELFTLQQQKKWDRTIRVEEIQGKTLGVLGAGSIGQEIARKAKVFGMKTLGLNRSGRPIEHFDQIYPTTELNQLLGACDYLVVVLPLTKETKHLLGAAEFGRMKESAYLINISRGEVVDEQALIAAIRDKRIAGAVLDVFCQEPLPVDSPLWDLDGVVITPHLSSRSPLYMERAMEIFADNLTVFLQGYGEMRNVIDLSKGY